MATKDINSPTPEPQPKVVGATIGAGLGVAVSTLLIYIIEAAARIDLPETVEGAIGVIITAGLTFVGGYLPKVRVYE